MPDNIETPHPSLDTRWSVIEDDGFIGMVGPFYQSGEGTGLRFCFPTDQRHRNRRGVLQGGALMTFSDRALGITARVASQSEYLATVNLDVSFIDAVDIGEVVETCPVLIRSMRQLIFINANLMVGSRTVAVATGIFKKASQAKARRAPDAEPQA